MSYQPTDYEKHNCTDPVLLAIKALEHRAAALDVMLADDDSNLGIDTYERLQLGITTALSRVIEDELVPVN